MKLASPYAFLNSCLGLLLLFSTGCHSIGPRSVPRDRFDYSSALAQSWKNQMLLNLVKTRYLDLPIFLDVGQIVSGYSLETSLNAGGNLPENANMGGSTATLGATARYTDRPTITYTPLTGDKFLESFLTPVDPVKVLGLIQAGYAADFILELGVDSLNGLRNRQVSLGTSRKSDPGFFRALALLREIQEADAVGIRVQRVPNTPATEVLFFRSDRIEPDVVSKISELRELLGLAPGQNSFTIVRSTLRGSPGELSLNTRSLSQMLTALSLGVEVPGRHQERKLAPPTPDAPANENSIFRVHSTSDKPSDAFAAVPYEGQWFWIANDDWKSKRTFSSILFLFTLASPGGSQNLPTLTIPTQ